jgi:hypothetical protein
VGERGYTALQQNRPITQAIRWAILFARGFATEMSVVKSFWRALVCDAATLIPAGGAIYAASL